MHSPSSSDGPSIKGYDFEISSSIEDRDEENERQKRRAKSIKNEKVEPEIYSVERKKSSVEQKKSQNGRKDERKKEKSSSSASSKLDTRIDAAEVREIRTYEKWLLRILRPSSKSLRTFMVIAGFLCATYYIHMYLQYEYYRRCKSNVFRVVLFKESHMCTHLANVLNVIENTYFVGMKRIIDAILLPLYNTGLPSSIM